MTDKQPITIFVSKSGEVRHVHSTEAAKITGDLPGERSLRRASKVEPTAELSDEAIAWLAVCDPEPRVAFVTWRPSMIPTAETCGRLRDTLVEIYPDRWWADLLPSGGPILGPFGTNQEALQAELDWLDAHQVPTVTTPPRELSDIPLQPHEAEMWLINLRRQYPAAARWLDLQAQFLNDTEWTKKHFGGTRRYATYRNDIPNPVYDLHRLRAEQAFAKPEQ